MGPIRSGPEIVAATMICTNIADRKRLEGEVLAIGEAEQARIGRDLHDGLGQVLTGIALLSKGLESTLADRSLSESDAAGEIAELAKQAIEQTRALARGLFPVALETVGLHGALEELAKGVESRSKISCRVEVTQPFHSPDRFRRVHLFRIAQEAVNNALRHGHPDNILIQLGADAGAMWLSVVDDGSGVQSLPDKSVGIGLRSMRYRAEMIGGTLSMK